MQCILVFVGSNRVNVPIGIVVSNSSAIRVSMAQHMAACLPESNVTTIIMEYYYNRVCALLETRNRESTIKYTFLCIKVVFMLGISKRLLYQISFNMTKAMGFT
jgi:hypothetical protein